MVNKKREVDGLCEFLRELKLKNDKILSFVI